MNDDGHGKICYKTDIDSSNPVFSPAPWLVMMISCHMPTLTLPQVASWWSGDRSCRARQYLSESRSGAEHGPTSGNWCGTAEHPSICPSKRALTDRHPCVW